MSKPAMKGAKVRRSMGRQPPGVENQLSEGPAMTLARRIAERAVDFARAYDVCGPDADAARERVMQAAEHAIQTLLDQWLESVVTNSQSEP